jgi:NTP pyrophosphatase (non-canonical NTP hydrolase)
MYMNKMQELSDIEKSKLCLQAANLWGIYPQMFIVAEECGELIAALSKYDRKRATKDDVLDEISDVRVMLFQAAQIVGVSSHEVNERETLKWNRLKERIVEAMKKKEMS